MGIRLITEVMDWAPDTLTQREHKVLIVFAEDAHDGEPGELDDRGREKRVMRQPLDSPRMLRRARVSRTQLYKVIAELIKEGCLERVTAGGGGHVARYRIPRLSPESCIPENRTQTPVDNSESCIPETGTQTEAVSRKLGRSESRFARDTDSKQDPYGTPNGAPVMADAESPGAARHWAAGGLANPSPFPDPGNGNGPEQLPPVERNLMNGVQLQSPATAPIAREDETELARQAQANRLREWERQHPEAAS